MHQRNINMLEKAPPTNLDMIFISMSEIFMLLISFSFQFLSDFVVGKMLLFIPSPNDYFLSVFSYR